MELVVAFYVVVTFILVPSWYLSSNGMDYPQCGNNRTNACKTLVRLLKRFHTTSSQINETLILFTDSSIIINTDLTVSTNFSSTQCQKCQKLK